MYSAFFQVNMRFTVLFVEFCLFVCFGEGVCFSFTYLADLKWSSPSFLYYLILTKLSLIN